MEKKGFLKKPADPETILLITAIIGGILYISLIFNDNLWVDEAFTASLIRGSWNEVVRDTFKDTLPPFYNFAGKLLTDIFGFSSTVLKIFSCIPVILLIFFGGKKAYKIRGFRTAYLFELFIMFMPYFFHYASEIRMYSWGIFSCGMTALFFLELVSGGEQVHDGISAWAGFTLFTVFSGYIHHFALVSCGMMWFLLLVYSVIRRDRKGLQRFGISLLIFILLFFPCLLLTVSQIKNAAGYFSMTPLSIKTLLSDIRFPFVTHATFLSLLLFLFAVITVFYSLFLLVTDKSEREDNASPCISGLMLCSVLYLTLAFGYAVSLLAGKSIFTARYLIPALPVFWLGEAVLADRLIAAFHDSRVITAALIALITVTGTVNYLNAFHEEYSTGVENMKAFFGENMTPEDGYIIYEDNYQIELCFRYYFPDLKKTDWDHAGEIGGNLWFIQTEKYKNKLENAEKYGYNSEYTGDFNFDRYSFSLYRLKKA